MFDKPVIYDSDIKYNLDKTKTHIVNITENTNNNLFKINDGVYDTRVLNHPDCYGNFDMALLRASTYEIVYYKKDRVTKDINRMLRELFEEFTLLVTKGRFPIEVRDKELIVRLYSPRHENKVTVYLRVKDIKAMKLAFIQINNRNISRNRHIYCGVCYPESLAQE
jgi:hypothetical protein